MKPITGRTADIDIAGMFSAVTRQVSFDWSDFLAFVIPAIYVFVNEWKYARKKQASALIVLCFVAIGVMSGPADMLYQRTFWLLIGAGLALIGRNEASKFKNPAE
jgi:hypothetical protein